jgi:hypothetical protein
MSDAEPGGPERVRWRWVIGCTAVGLALLTVALKGQTWWKWQGVAPGIVVNLGTAFLIAAVLFFMERRFTARVVQAGKRAVAEAAEQVEERLEQQTEALSARIDDLQEQVDRRMQDRAQEQDRKIANLREVASFDTVTEAMTEANRFRAIVWGGVTVPASSDPDGIAVTFRWGFDRNKMLTDGPRPRLDIIVTIEADFDLPGLRPYIATPWEPSETPAEVADRLIQALQLAGRWNGPGTLDWPLALRNLHRALELAVTSRRDGQAVGTWRLHGALYELIGEDWAITEAGVENRADSNVVLRESDFPATSHKPWGKPADEWPPEKPQWATAEEWDRVLRHGERKLPMDHGPVATSPIWTPWTQSIPSANGR